MKTNYKNKLMAISLSLFMSTTWLLACNNSGEGTTDDTGTNGVAEQEMYPDNIGTGDAKNAQSGTFPANGDTSTNSSIKRADDSINNELKSHGNIQESNLPR